MAAETQQFSTMKKTVFFHENFGYTFRLMYDVLFRLVSSFEQELVVIERVLEEISSDVMLQ